MRPSLVALLLALSVTVPVRAQTGSISGRVVDADHRPIPGAHVVVERPYMGTACDAAGVFLLHDVPVGLRVIVVSAVGFQVRRLEVDVVPAQRATVEIVLAEQMLESAEVVVTAVRRPQATSMVPVSVSVLTSADLVTRNVRALDEALRLAPGVHMAETQVSIRGSSGFSYNVGSRILLLVDGMPLLGPETGGVPFDALPMPQVARIEVVKGPGSALYGSGALGGVINVITREFPDEPETSAAVYAGVHEPVRYEMWRDAWSEGSRYRGLGGLSLTHARKAGEHAGGWVHLSYRRDRGYLRLGADEVMQAYAKLGWNPSGRLSLRMMGGITGRERDSFLYWDGIDNVLNPGTLDLLAPGSTDETGSNDNRSIQVSILPSLRHVVSPSVFHHLRLRYFLIQIRPIDEFGRSKPLEQGTTGFRFGGEWQIDWKPGDRAYVTGGVSADANAAKSSFFRGGDGGYVVAQPELAAFTQYERRIGNRLNLLAGVRFDVYQVDTTTTSSRLGPKLSISYSLHRDASLRASYGQGFRVPGIAERYVDNQDFFPFFPNHSLKPELSTGYEVGARLERRFSPRISLNLDAALFWNDYRRLVEPRFVTDPANEGTRRPGFQFINLTRARIRGAEILLEGAMPAGITVRTGYTLLDSRDLSEDRPLVFRSRHLLKLSLEAPLGARLRIAGDYRAASRPQRIDSDFARFVPDADVMVPTHVLDVRTSVSFSAFTASLLISNALDYYYVERPAYLAPPRQYVFQLRADF